MFQETISRLYISIELFTFSWIVAQSVMQMFDIKPLSQGRRSLLAAAVEGQARYDKSSDWTISMMQWLQRLHNCDKFPTLSHWEMQKQVEDILWTIKKKIRVNEKVTKLQCTRCCNKVTNLHGWFLSLVSIFIQVLHEVFLICKSHLNVIRIF